MKRTIAVGIQDFRTMIEKDYFYLDKTGFIKEWWKNTYDEYGGTVLFGQVF